MFAAEESLALGIATLVVGLLGTIFTGIMTYLMARLKVGQAQAAVAVANVATAAAEAKDTLANATATFAGQLNEIAKVGEATHLLCNSAMLAQKRLLAVSARALADKTGDPVDMVAANQAEKELREHSAKQLILDKNGNKP